MLKFTCSHNNSLFLGRKEAVKTIKTMKIKALKNYNKIIANILSILGIGSATLFSCSMYGTPLSPVPEYGVPGATFKINGTISNKSNEKIPGIQVILNKDTTLANSEGKYAVQTESYAGEQSFKLEISDIDGDLNGEFHPVDTTVAFVDPKFENGDGEWYLGETSKNLDIKLKDKN